MIYQIFEAIIEGEKHSTGNIHWGPLEKDVSDFAKGHSLDDEVDRAAEQVQSLEVAVTETGALIYLNTHYRPGALHTCIFLFLSQTNPQR